MNNYNICLCLLHDDATARVPCASHCYLATILSSLDDDLLQFDLILGEKYWRAIAESGAPILECRWSAGFVVYRNIWTEDSGSITAIHKDATLVNKGYDDKE